MKTKVHNTVLAVNISVKTLYPLCITCIKRTLVLKVGTIRVMKYFKLVHTYVCTYVCRVAAIIGA